MINIMHLIAVPRVCKGLSGGDKVILLLSQHIDKSRFSVVIVGLKDSPEIDSYLIQEANKISISTDMIEMSNRFDVRAIFNLREQLKKRRIDILHCHGYKADIVGFIATRFTNIKLITTVHGWIGIDIKVKLYDFLDLLVVRFFTRVVAVSNTIGKILLRFGLSKNQVVVIHNGIDADRYNEKLTLADIRKDLNIPQNSYIIGTIGRLSLEKGHKYFIEAASKVKAVTPNTVFLMVGEGPLKMKLIKQAEKLSVIDKVFFLGFRADVQNLLAVMDIFVLPSLREGLPISVLEAMAMSKPVVATDVGDIPLLIESGKAGILVSPKDVTGLADAIIKLLNDKEMAAEMGRNAKDLVKRDFSVEPMVKKYEVIYNKVVNE